MSSRRRFIKLGAASLGSLALPKFGLLPALAQAKASTDYKALVCVFLFGGNDSNNTIIPIDLPNSTYSQYKNLRASLALSEAQLTQPIADKKGVNWAFHAALPDLANFFKLGNLAVAANVGPLVQPVNRGQVSNPNLDTRRICSRTPISKSSGKLPTHWN